MKRYIMLLPLFLMSCAAEPTIVSSSSDALAESIGTDSNPIVVSSFPDASAKPTVPSCNPITGTYSLSRSANGADFQSLSIVFDEEWQCVFEWVLDDASYVSRQTYSIECGKVVIFSFAWDEVSFAPSLREGDSDLPESLTGCEYKYLNEDHSKLTFESAGVAYSFDEQGSETALGKTIYEFSLNK